MHLIQYYIQYTLHNELCHCGRMAWTRSGTILYSLMSYDRIATPSSPPHNPPDHSSTTSTEYLWLLCTGWLLFGPKPGLRQKVVGNRKVIRDLRIGSENLLKYRVVWIIIFFFFQRTPGLVRVEPMFKVFVFTAYTKYCTIDKNRSLILTYYTFTLTRQLLQYFNMLFRFLKEKFLSLSLFDSWSYRNLVQRYTASQPKSGEKERNFGWNYPQKKLIKTI